MLYKMPVMWFLYAQKLLRKAAQLEGSVLLTDTLILVYGLFLLFKYYFYIANFKTIQSYSYFVLKNMISVQNILRDFKKEK